MSEDYTPSGTETAKMVDFIPDKVQLDHPCRDTCSGWQQGFDKGTGMAWANHRSREIEREALIDENEKLKEKLKETEESLKKVLQRME